MTVNLLDANRTFLDMRDGDFEIVHASPEAVLRRLVRVRGVDFDEAFVAELIGNHFIRKEMHAEPKISDAVAIYLHESDAGDGRKFRGDVLHVFRRFSSLFGDLCPVVNWPACCRCDVSNSVSKATRALPIAYFKDVLTSLPGQMNSCIEKLLPQRW